MEKSRKEKWDMLKALLRKAMKDFMDANAAVIQKEHWWFKRSDLTAARYVIGEVIPFVLFWAGMSLAFFTDDVFILMFALVPFYVWLYLGSSVTVMVFAMCAYMDTREITWFEALRRK